MPTVEEDPAKLTDAKVFNKLNANAGYWQTPLAEESQELTTFITLVGRFQFLRLPFGIATAPEFFQREMLCILEGLPGQACHQDDIVVFGMDVEDQDHDAKLKAMQRLRESGMRLNAKKCKFQTSSINFLGHVLDSEGIFVDPAKTRAVGKVSSPGNMTELWSFDRHGKPTAQAPFRHGKNNKAHEKSLTEQHSLDLVTTPTGSLQQAQERLDLNTSASLLQPTKGADHLL